MRCAVGEEPRKLCFNSEVIHSKGKGREKVTKRETEWNNNRKHDHTHMYAQNSSFTDQHCTLKRLVFGVCVYFSVFGMDIHAFSVLWTSVLLLKVGSSPSTILACS